jgi:hypothetical protein
MRDHVLDSAPSNGHERELGGNEKCVRQYEDDDCAKS